MKATMCLLPAVLILALTGGCAIWRAPVVPPPGLLFTQYRAPLTPQVTGVPVAQKVGTHTCRYFAYSLLSFAWDDAAIAAAAKEGGLSKVYYADYDVLNILGIYTQFTVHAYGE
jgi:hypothetical protein